MVEYLIVLKEIDINNNKVNHNKHININNLNNKHINNKYIYNNHNNNINNLTNINISNNNNINKIINILNKHKMDGEDEMKYNYINFFIFLINELINGSSTNDVTFLVFSSCHKISLLLL